MAGPWEQFQAQAKEEQGPWTQYAKELPASEDGRDFFMKATDERFKDSPNLQILADAMNPVRIMKAVPGAIAAAGRGFVHGGITGATALPYIPAAGVSGAMEIGEQNADTITTLGGLLKPGESEKAAGEVIGKGFNKAGEVAGNIVSAVNPIGISDEELKQFEKLHTEGKISKETMLQAYKDNAAWRTGGEVAGQVAAPIPGVKAANRGVERVIGNALEKDMKGTADKMAETLQERQEVEQAKQKAFTEGAQQAPWELFGRENLTPKSPYEIANKTIDENGIPIDSVRTDEIAKNDAVAAPQGDMLYEHGPGAIQAREGGSSIRNAPETNPANDYPMYRPESDLALKTDETLGFTERRSQAEPINYIGEKGPEAAPPYVPLAGRGNIPGKEGGAVENPAGGLVGRGYDILHKTIMGNAKTTVGGLTEAAKLGALDRRSATDLVKSIDPSTVEDIGTSKKVALNVLDIDGVIAATKDTPGAGPIVKWVRDSLKLIDRTKMVVKEDLLKGTDYGNSLRGFEFRTTSKDSPVEVFKEGIKSNPKEMNQMIRSWFDAMRDGVEPTFKTDRQKAIYSKWQDVFGKLLDGTNELRGKAGLSPIDKQTAFFPLMRTGDYRIIVEDKNGELKGAFHVPNVFYGKMLQKQLAKEFPELSVGDPLHLEKSKYDYGHSDFMAMEAAGKALKDQPDLQAAVHRAYADIMRHRGFGGKHGIESNHILGAMGLEEGRTGAIKMLDAFESYTNRMIEYQANLEKKGKMAELTAALGSNPEVKGKLNNTMQLVSDIYDNSRGASKDKLQAITEVFNTIGRASGLGENGFRQRLRDVTSLATAWMLATPSFIISQAMQPATGLAGLSISEGGGIKGLGSAGIDVFKGYAKAIMPSALDKEGVSWAAKHGYITPEVAELLNTRSSNLNSSLTKKTKDSITLLGGTLEKEVVRIPYFLMQMESLKGQIKGSKEALFEAAAEATDKYMVDYGKSNQAMMWGKMGVLGENTRTLKAFANNMLGQFAEYATQAKRGDLTPMATYLGVSVLLAGLTGNILAQTADDIVRKLNAIGSAIGQNWNIPTMQETVMKSGQSDLATFGVSSTILGHDVSSSQAQNSLKSILSVPVAELGVQTAKDVLPYLLKSLKGEDTEADKMKAFMALTPPFAKEAMKSQFIKDGIVPDPNHQMAKIYQRPQEERYLGMTTTEMIGRAPLDEVRAKNIISAARQDIKENIHDRNSTANALADSIIEGKSLDNALVEKWVKEGGNPANLNELVKKRVLDHAFDFVDREYQKKGISGAAEQEAIKKDKEALKKIQLSDKELVDQQKQDSLEIFQKMKKYNKEFVQPPNIYSDSNMYPLNGQFQRPVEENAKLLDHMWQNSPGLRVPTPPQFGPRDRLIPAPSIRQMYEGYRKQT